MRANQRPSKTSGSALQHLLGELTAEDFFAQYWDRSAAHIPGRADTHRWLFGWHALNDVLNSLSPKMSSVRLYHKVRGSIQPRSAQEVISAAGDGATLIVEDIDRVDTLLGSFLSALTAEIGESTRFNLYASSIDIQGFPSHFDSHDVFILQVDGDKTWRIWPPTVEAPTFIRINHEAPTPTGAPYLEVTLTAGDTLYIPRGHWHEAIAREKASLHLTLAVFARTGLDLLTWLINELREDARFRRLIPIRPYGASARQEHLDMLTTALNEALANGGEVLDRYERYAVATSKHRSPFNFPYHLARHGHAIGLQTLIDGNVASHVAVNDGTLCLLTASGRVATAPSAAWPIIERVLKGPPITVHELLSNHYALASEEILQLLGTLMSEGFIRECPRPA